MVRSGLVTGASRGIGFGIAELLAQRGYGLTITARSTEGLEAVAGHLREIGSPHVQCIAGDAASEEDVERVVDAHSEAFDALDTLVLAAGVGSAGALAEYPLARWDKQFAVNTRSAFVAIRRSLPLLREAAAGRPGQGAKIIALSSIGGIYAEPQLAAYGASKAGLISLCRSVNMEESSAGVSATAIAPGYVDTEMSKWVHEQIPPESMIAVSDVVSLVAALLDLSTKAVVSEIVVARAGATRFHA